MKKFLITFIFISIFTLSACGPTVRVTVKGTRDGVNISTSQTASDSSAVNIKIDPTINFHAVQ